MFSFEIDANVLSSKKTHELLIVMNVGNIWLSKYFANEIVSFFSTSIINQLVIHDRVQ